MEIRNEPKVSQEINLLRITILGSVIVGALITIFFFFGGMFTSKDAKAASTSIPAGTTVYSNVSPFVTLTSGDTLFIYGVLDLNSSYLLHINNVITIVVDGSSAELRFKKNKDLWLGTGSSIILLNGGSITSYNGCNSGTSIYFGLTEVADCSGGGGTPSFSDINAAGGISSTGAPLPVEWLDVSATALTEGEVEVSWKTAAEINNSHFDVEYSLDATNWSIAQVVNSRAVGGNSSEILSYSVLHHLPSKAERVYYRVKQMDYDGQFDYTDIMVVHFEIKAGINIATLGNSKIRVNVQSDLSKESTVKIFNETGALLTEEVIEEQRVFSLPQAGLYIVEVATGSDVQRIKHMVK